MFRRYAAEFVGTFFIVFMPVAVGSTGQWPGGASGLAAAAWVSGLVLTAMVSALGPVSAAHFNPAVTVGLACTGRFPWSRVPGYAVAQFAGGFLAASTARAVLGQVGGTHVPAVGMLGQSFVMEVLITAALLVVVMAVATDRRVAAPTPALAIGLAVVVGIMVAGPLSGGSMNPARSFGPAVVAGGAPLANVWLYLVAPVVGGVLGAWVYERLRLDPVSAQSAPPDAFDA
ncbi:MAG: aquaporin [Fimbriimonadaceae bacterium]|nr:aquaporin [Fimbriimonadaceae bacterium]